MQTTTHPSTRNPLEGYTIGAELLHAYADPTYPFKDWFGFQVFLSDTAASHGLSKRQISEFWMREGIDYKMLDPGDLTVHGSNMIITLSRAIDIAIEQSTKRAQQLRICLAKLEGASIHDQPEFEELVQLLLEAEATAPALARNQINTTGFSSAFEHTYGLRL